MRYTPLRQVIAERIDELQLTQQEVEDRTGILRFNLSRFLSGRRDMSGANLDRLLEALELQTAPVPPRRKKST